MVPSGAQSSRFLWTVYISRRSLKIQTLNNGQATHCKTEHLMKLNKKVIKTQRFSFSIKSLIMIKLYKISIHNGFSFDL